MKITLPVKTIKDGDGKDINAFLVLCGIVIENTTQKSDAETYLVKSLRDKIDAATTELELTDGEIAELKKRFKELQDQNKVSGSIWYFFRKPLDDAK